jgi:hypothetical protein
MSTRYQVRPREMTNQLQKLPNLKAVKCFLFFNAAVSIILFAGSRQSWTLMNLYKNIKYFIWICQVRPLGSKGGISEECFPWFEFSTEMPRNPANKVITTGIILNYSIQLNCVGLTLRSISCRLCATAVNIHSSCFLQITIRFKPTKP